MAFPNKPYIGDQTPNQPFNYPETPATFDRLFGALVPNIQLDPEPFTPAPAPNPWTRPADWLPLPAPSQSQELFRGLFAVYDLDSNFLAFTFEGNYTVDWGDGIIENFGSGDKAQHEYNWDSVPEATLTTRGYRQVIVTVTPQLGSNLTTMDLSSYHDNIGLDGAYYPNVPWLDISVSMPQADSGYSMYFGTADYSDFDSLEKVTIVNTGGATEIYSLLEYAFNLAEFNLLHAPEIEDMTDVLSHCYSLQKINIGDLPSAYNLSNAFIDCRSLKQVELTGLESADSFQYMFDNCTSLESVKMSGLTTADYSLYDLVSSYINQPNTRSLTLEDLNSLSNLQDVFYDWGWDLRGSVKLTGLSGLTNMDYGFEYNYGLQSVELHGLDNVTSAYEAFYDCESLTSVVLEGAGNIQDTSYMFSNCYTLVTAPEFDTSSVTDMYDMFEYCYSLQNVPQYNTSNVEDMDYMFYECWSLKTIPHFNTSSVVYFYNMFYECFSLQGIPLLNTSSGEEMNEMFYSCSGLKSVPALDVSSCYNFDDIFNNCSVLASAPLQGTSNDISYYNCCLSRNAIVAIFQGLAESVSAINVSYNYGADDLTAEDIAIAEDKGWTVFY